MSKSLYISLDVKLTGQRIRTVMIEHGYTVGQIQDILNLACPQSVYRWIHGYTLPSVDNLYRLSKLFCVHMEDLLVDGAADETDDKSENEME